MVYKTSGVCSSAISFEIDEQGKVHDVKFQGGCSGNTQGVAKLIEGMDAKEAISRLEGIRCGFRPTSCPNDIQEKMFEMLGFTREAAYEQFGFLLNAFKYGVPPHAGLAYGLDRLVMLMAKVDSIRDVIAFPKVKDASCLMTESPSRVSEQQLEELGLEVEPETEE